MATIATIPELPVSGRSTQLVFSPSDGGNFVKVWCTSAPRGSKLRQQLDDTQAQRVVVIGESDISKRPSYTFDVGGAYALIVEEYQKGAASYGGGWKGSPEGNREESLLSSVSASLYVASQLEVTVGIPPDTAKLRVYVHDSEIIETRQSIHGVTTPGLFQPSSDIARAACDSDEVQSALDDLPGSAATVLGSLSTLVTNLIDNYNGHRSFSGHNEPDTVNVVKNTFRYPNSARGILKALAELRKQLDAHMRNVDPTVTESPGDGSADFHNVAGNELADWTNTIIAQPSSGDLAAGVVLLADLWRCLNGHVRSTAFHSSADSTRVPIPLSALLNVHRSFLSQLAELTPTVPSNEHSAKVTLVSGAGFKEI